MAIVPATLQPLLSARLNHLIPSTQRATVLSFNGLVTELGLDLRTVPTVAGIPRFLFGAALREVGRWAAVGLAAVLW